MPETILSIPKAKTKNAELKRYVQEFAKTIRKQSWTTDDSPSDEVELFVGYRKKGAQADIYHIAGNTGDGWKNYDAALNPDYDTQSEIPSLQHAEVQPVSYVDDCVEPNVDLLGRLQTENGTVTPALICEAELTRFETEQVAVLLPILWNYILENRDSNIRKELVAAGSAIRKFIALMPIEKMGDLAVLLESGTRASLPIELEIEVAKMIYRNFEVFPPASPDPHPELAQRLMEIAEAYTNPRLLPRDKYSAAASLAIEALVAMQSTRASDALQLAANSQFHWFAEIVEDDLDRLRDRWANKSPTAATWLDGVRSEANLND